MWGIYRAALVFQPRSSSLRATEESSGSRTTATPRYTPHLSFLYINFPKGFAQLVESPTTFHIQPMQIDTKNRHYNGTDFKPDLMPKASLAPPDARGAKSCKHGKHPCVIFSPKLC